MSVRLDAAILAGKPKQNRGLRLGLIVVAMVLFTAGAYASTAPMVVASSGAALMAITLLLWRKTEPPILLIPPLFQWSEVSLPPISTIWLRVPLDDLSMRSADLESAAYYGLMGVVMLAIGLRLALGFRKTRFRLSDLASEARALSFRNIAPAVFSLIVIGYIFAIGSAFVGPARELFNSASLVKNAGLFILAYWCLTTGRNLNVLVGVFGFEILFGMTGFFAEFKDSALTLVLAALVARPKVNQFSFLAVFIAVSLLLGAAVFWSSIKFDYRLFVNQGSGAQVILVPIDERVAYIGDKLFDFSAEDAQNGFDLLVSRHGYIDYLAQTMEFVPFRHPHENGAITWSVIRHITMPRLLFPDKPPLPNDTRVTAEYTGQSRMLWDDNTSISIGHLGELYVDFGYVGGLLGMLGIGLIVGGVFRKLADHRGTPHLLNAGLCVMATLPLAYFGTAYVKLVGALIFCSLIAVVFQRIAWRIFPGASVVQRVLGRSRKNALRTQPHL